MIKKAGYVLVLTMLLAGCASDGGESFFKPQNFDLEPPLYPVGDR